MPPFAVRSTSDHLAADQLDAWCTLFEGCTRINALVPRQHATALGVIQRLRLVPDESMEAVIDDGTGRLRVVWTGSDPLNGLELGRGLRVEGTVSLDSGQKLMRNPTWCVVRDPYACAEKEREKERAARTEKGVSARR